jgi:hypothetical protein
MAICAGYVSGAPWLDSEQVKEVMENFSVLKDDGDAGSTVRTISTKYGYQLCKYNLDAANQPYIARDCQGNVLVILGFIHWDGVEKPAEIENALLRRVVEKGPRILEDL